MQNKEVKAGQKKNQKSKIAKRHERRKSKEKRPCRSVVFRCGFHCYQCRMELIVVFVLFHVRRFFCISVFIDLLFLQGSLLLEMFEHRNV